MTSQPGADDHVARFLQGVLDAGNDVAPVGVLFGPNATQDEQLRAHRIAAVIHDDGLIEPTIRGGWGSGGDLQRVRVTPYGVQWLAQRGR